VKFNKNRFPYTSLFGVTTVSSETDRSQSLPLSPVTTSTNSHSLSTPNISPLTATTDDMSSTPRGSSSFDSPTVSTSDHQPSSSATISPSLDTTLPNNNHHFSSLPLNTHTMLTRSKTGHSKPKDFIVHLEPSLVKQALSQPHWLETMKSEHNALIAITHGHLLHCLHIENLLVVSGSIGSKKILMEVSISTKQD